jgi:hypothetical protein
LLVVARQRKEKENEKRERRNMHLISLSLQEEIIWREQPHEFFQLVIKTTSKL